MPTVSVEKAFDQLILRNHFDYENLSLNEKEVISNIVIKLKFISFFRTFCFVHFSMDNRGKLLLDGSGHPIGLPLAERQIF